MVNESEKESHADNHRQESQAGGNLGNEPCIRISFTVHTTQHRQRIKKRSGKDPESGLGNAFFQERFQNTRGELIGRQLQNHHSDGKHQASDRYHGAADSCEHTASPIGTTFEQEW